MTREEVKQRAEQFVYCDCTLGDILYHCQMVGIKTHTPKGKQKSRSELETALIEYYTEAYIED